MGQDGHVHVIEDQESLTEKETFERRPTGGKRVPCDCGGGKSSRQMDCKCQGPEAGTCWRPVLLRHSDWKVKEVTVGHDLAPRSGIRL